MAIAIVHIYSIHIYSIHVYIYICMYKYIYIYVYILYICIHTIYIYIYIHTYIHTIYIYILYIYIHTVYVYIYIYIYIHTIYLHILYIYTIPIVWGSSIDPSGRMWNMYSFWLCRFWKSAWNCFDVVVVSIGLMNYVLPDLPGPLGAVDTYGSENYNGFIDRMDFWWIYDGYMMDIYILYYYI